MRSCLDLVKNWKLMAQRCGYKVARLAAKCGVSQRQLERYWLARFRMRPHRWLRRTRLRIAVQWLKGRVAIKVIAERLCYTSTAHFNRDFKAMFGVTPHRFIAS